MGPLWIVAAFMFGAAASRIGLPPLVGYLVAGFVLNAIGIQGGATLQEIADVGVTLLLFTIGLKLSSAFAVRQLKEAGYRGQIPASVRYEDQIATLKEAGVGAAYSLYEEAGVGFADHVCVHMDVCGFVDAAPRRGPVTWPSPHSAIIAGVEEMP